MNDQHTPFDRGDASGAELGIEAVGQIVPDGPGMHVSHLTRSEVAQRLSPAAGAMARAHDGLLEFSSCSSFHRGQREPWPSARSACSWLTRQVVSLGRAHRQNNALKAVAVLTLGASLLAVWMLRADNSAGPCVVANGPAMVPEIPETSGLAVSRRNPGLLWSHNDSGSAAVLFALDTAGTLRGRVARPDSHARLGRRFGRAMSVWRLPVHRRHRRQQASHVDNLDLSRA